MTEGTIHIIGAGLAGLSAAVHLTAAGRKIELYEAGPYAGGRCRSYLDKELDCRIDNGNHLLLTCNTAALFYLELIGAERTVHIPKRSTFPFVDLETGARWQLHINDGKFPWWIFSSRRRVPDTRSGDYLRDFRALLRAKPTATVAEMLEKSPLYKRFWTPLTVAILNTAPYEAAASMLAHVFKEAFGFGGRGCRPVTMKEGLSESFIDPALRFIEKRGGKIYFGKRLRGVEKAEGEIRKLVFADSEMAIARWDWVVLALPPWSTVGIVPDVNAPTEYRSIVNAHFRLNVPRSETGVIGLINGTAEWVFEKQGIVSTTTSAAEKIIDKSAEELAELLWKDVARLYKIEGQAMPPHRIVKEKRATFAATPQQTSRRLKIEARYGNLVICGDWTETRLPSTIEGAIRSGREAAATILPPAERRFSR